MAVKTQHIRFNRGKSSSKKSSSSSKKSSKEKGFEVPEIHVPRPDIYGEMMQTVRGLEEAYPRLAALEQEYADDFARAEANAATERARAELAGVRELGGDVREAILDASPGARKADALIQRELDAAGPSAIENELKAQALEELRLRGELSADEVRQVTQGSRAAQSARGLATGSAAAVEELMRRAQYAEERKAGRRAFAAGVDTMETQREASDRAFGINALNAEVGNFDPYTRLYGKGGSQITGQVQGPAQFAQFQANTTSRLNNADQLSLTAQLAQMEAAQNAYQFEQNLAWDKEAFGVNRADSNANAAANRKAGNTAAVAGAVGTVAAAALIAF